MASAKTAPAAAAPGAKTGAAPGVKAAPAVAAVPGAVPPDGLQQVVIFIHLVILVL